MHTQHAIATKKKAGGVVTAVFSDMLDRGVWVVVGAWGCARGGVTRTTGFLCSIAWRPPKKLTMSSTPFFGPSFLASRFSKSRWMAAVAQNHLVLHDAGMRFKDLVKRWWRAPV